MAAGDLTAVNGVKIRRTADGFVVDDASGLPVHADGTLVR